MANAKIAPPRKTFKTHSFLSQKLFRPPILCEREFTVGSQRKYRILRHFLRGFGLWIFWLQDVSIGLSKNGLRLYVSKFYTIVQKKNKVLFDCRTSDGTVLEVESIHVLGITF